MTSQIPLQRYGPDVLARRGTSVFWRCGYHKTKRPTTKIMPRNQNADFRKFSQISCHEDPQRITPLSSYSCAWLCLELESELFRSRSHDALVWWPHSSHFPAQPRSRSIDRWNSSSYPGHTGQSCTVAPVELAVGKNLQLFYCSIFEIHRSGWLAAVQERQSMPEAHNRLGRKRWGK